MQRVPCVTLVDFETQGLFQTHLRGPIEYVRGSVKRLSVLNAQWTLYCSSALHGLARCLALVDSQQTDGLD